MLGARAATACAIALLALLAGTAVGCGDDGGDADEPDCTPTIDEFCDEQGCDDDRTLDGALATLAPTNPHSFAALGECDGQIVLRRGDITVSASYAYDADSGELIGVGDLQSDAPLECDRQLSAGKPVADCGSCQLFGAPPDGTLDVTPCTGARAQPFLDACMQDPPELVADCAQCACEHCYPALGCEDPDPDAPDGAWCAVIGARCALEHCDDCAMLQAAAAR